jgi:cephalosporin hydroxylase
MEKFEHGYRESVRAMAADANVQRENDRDLQAKLLLTVAFDGYLGRVGG